MKKGVAEQSNGSDARQPNKSKQPKILTMEELEAEGIFILKEKSARFPEAIAYCRVCEYHVHSLEQHVRHPDHKKAIMERKRVERLGLLPDPTPTHSAALTVLVEQIAQTHGRPVEHLLAISKLAETLTAELQKVVHTECHVRVYGSSQTGLALRTSNVNLELVYPEESVNHSAALISALKFISSCDDFTNVTSNFESLWPSVTFYSRSLTDIGAPLCVLSVRNLQAYEIGRLLRVYVDFRSQLTILGQALRYWARVCKLDDGTAGGLPPYAFDLMLIHFLQQHDYLPVLQEIPTSESEKRTVDGVPCSYQSDLNIISQEFKGRSEDWNLGDIWWHFFKYYAVMRASQESIVQIRQKRPVNRDEKNWTKKRIAIEDPFLPNKNLAQFSQTMYDYFVGCLQATYIYFGIPRTRTGAIFQFDVSKQPSTPPKSRPAAGKEKNRTVNNCAATLKTSEKEVATSDKQLNDRPSEREDSPPSAPSPNSNNISSCEYSSTLMRHLAKGPLANRSLPQEIATKCENAKIFFPNPGCSADQECDDQECEIEEGEVEVRATVAACFAIQVVSSMSSSEEKESENASSVDKEGENEREDDDDSDEEEPTGADVIELDDDDDEDDDTADERPSGSVDASADSPSPVDDHHPIVDIDQLGEKLATLVITDFHYNFDETCLCGDLIAEVTCMYCTVAGHKEADCPEKKLPDIIPLPSMTQELHDDTEALLSFLYNTNKITRYQMDFMEQMRSMLYQMLDTHLFPGSCRLDLFGSARNGFGSCFSDIDLCLRFNEDQLPSYIDPRVIIQQCAELLSTDRNFHEVVPITTAKVPIVKFRHYWQTVEGDISLYNVLALRNTDMLRTYAMMDRRVQTLGIVVKSWAKHCDIGDASRGSLSSYSFIIMLIHYLQRCDPPVVPVLQEMDNEDGSKSVMVEGWNTYFFSDMKVLRNWSRNRQSVAELWLGFLKYYAEQKFHPALDVVQIRQLKPLSKFDKLWTGKPLAIEDPFDLNHNLAAGLGKRMFSYIWRCLIRARSVFGNPEIHRTFLRTWNVPSVQSVEGQFAKFMLAEARLKEDPPRDRVCRICGTVGHFAESCPRNRRNRAAAKKQQQDAQQNHGYNQQRYGGNDRRPPSTPTGDPWKRPLPSRSISHDIVSSPNTAQQSTPSQRDQRRSTATDDKSANRKERRQRKEDARRAGEDWRQSNTPSSAGEAIEEEQMAVTLGMAFVNSINSLPPTVAYSRSRGGGAAGGHPPSSFPSHPRGGYVQRHRPPRPPLQHQLSTPTGSRKNAAAVSVVQPSTVTVSAAPAGAATATDDVPAVISGPPGASRGKPRKQSSPSKRRSPPDSATTASAPPRRERKQLANGPPGWNKGGVKTRGGLGRGQVADMWKDE